MGFYSTAIRKTEGVYTHRCASFSYISHLGMINIHILNSPDSVGEYGAIVGVVSMAKLSDFPRGIDMIANVGDFLRVISGGGELS